MSGAVTTTTIIHLDSKFANYKGNHGVFTFDSSHIQAPMGSEIYLKVRDFTMPYTFYQINNNNSKLDYLILPATHHTLNIPHGNYTIDELVSYLNDNLLGGLSCTFNSINGKLTFTIPPPHDFIFMDTSTCLGLFGYNDITSDLSPESDGNVLTTGVVNMNPINTLCIHSNITTQNFMMHNDSRMSLLCCVPVLGQQGDLIYYDNRSSSHFNDTQQFYLNSIEISITDTAMNTIFLNGGWFNITLELTFVQEVTTEEEY